MSLKKEDIKIDVRDSTDQSLHKGLGEVLTTALSPTGRQKDADMALDFLANADEKVEYDPVVDKKLLRKIDLYLLPLLCFLYSCQYMDKTTNGYAAVMGLKKDLNMQGNQYSWTGTAFYIGYLFFEFPANMILQRFPLAKTTALFIFIWGVILMLHSVPSYPGFIALRTLLGVFESSISPAMVILTGQWYRKEEQFMRTTIWFCCNGWGTIMGALISYGCFKHEASFSIEAWKVMYFITGGLTILLSLVFVLHIPDNPSKAWFLTNHEKLLVIERIRHNQQGFGNTHFKKSQFMEALTDPITWIFALYGISSCIPNGALGNFGAILLASDFGFTPAQSLLMNCPGGAVEIVGCLLMAYINKWIPHRMVIALISMVIMLVSSCMLAFANDSNARLAGYYLISIYPTATICILSIFQSNVAGHTKKITVTAIFFCSYCVGNLIGPQTFIASQAPGYVGGKIAIVVCAAVTIVLVLLIYLRYIQLNARKEKNMKDSYVAEFENMEFADLTDFENPLFRYSL